MNVIKQLSVVNIDECQLSLLQMSLIVIGTLEVRVLFICLTLRHALIKLYLSWLLWYWQIKLQISTIIDSLTCYAYCYKVMFLFTNICLCGNTLNCTHYRSNRLWYIFFLFLQLIFAAFEIIGAIILFCIFCVFSFNNLKDVTIVIKKNTD